MSFLKWGFRSSLTVHQSSAEESIQLPLKAGGTISFTKLIQEKIPTLDANKKIWLNPFLFNGTLQTMYYNANTNAIKFLVYYGRELFTYKDEGICSIDWVIPKPESKEEFKRLYDESIPKDSPRLNSRTRFFTEEEYQQKTKVDEQETKPLVVILHGLGGGSHEPLIRNVAESFTTENKWDSLVINSRGCCRTKITTGTLFNAFSSEDIKEVLVELRRRYPNRPIYTVGFSFGAALLTNLLGDQDEEVSKLIKAAVLIGCPWDLHDSAYHINESWSGSYLFNPALAKFLNKIVKNNYKELHSHNPEIFNEKALEESKHHTKTWQFDSTYTCKTAGYSNVFDYYRDGSPVKRIRYINTPTLAISSTDDPAVSCRIPWMESKSNPYMSLIETQLGGHLAYAQWSGKYWCAEAVHDYLTEFEKLTK